MRDDSGMSMASVIVAMVILGVALPVLLANYSRATAAAWNAKAEQQAVAVAAWHTAEAQAGGCAVLDADNDPDNGYEIPGVKYLIPGEEFLPHDGFAVRCELVEVEWPPNPRPGDRSCSGDGCAEVLTVTTSWSKLNGNERSLPLSVLRPPS